MKIKEILSEEYDGKKVDADNLRYNIIRRNHAFNLHKRAVAHYKTLPKDELTQRAKHALRSDAGLTKHYQEEIAELKAKIVQWNKDNPDYKVSVSLDKEAKPINKERIKKSMARERSMEEIDRRAAKLRKERGL